MKKIITALVLGLALIVGFAAPAQAAKPTTAPISIRWIDGGEGDTTNTYEVTNNTDQTLTVHVQHFEPGNSFAVEEDIVFVAPGGTVAVQGPYNLDGWATAGTTYNGQYFYYSAQADPGPGKSGKSR